MPAIVDETLHKELNCADSEKDIKALESSSDSPQQSPPHSPSILPRTPTSSPPLPGNEDEPSPKPSLSTDLENETDAKC